MPTPHKETLIDRLCRPQVAELCKFLSCIMCGLIVILGIMALVVGVGEGMPDKIIAAVAGVFVIAIGVVGFVWVRSLKVHYD